MPYKTEKTKLPKSLDRRYKVTDKDKEEITRLRKQGLPIREIARRFEKVCSRRTIQLILFPERREKMKENGKIWRAENGNTLERYGRRAWRETMREHRHYKHQVLNNE